MPLSQRRHDQSAARSETGGLTVDQLDPFEHHMLEIARRLEMAIDRTESLAWIEAFRRAEMIFPPPFGATIANAILIALTALHQSRTVAVACHDPDCSHSAARLTSDERYLMRGFQAIRAGRQADAQAQVLLLCAGGPTHQVLAALGRLAIITGDAQV